MERIVAITVCVCIFIISSQAIVMTIKTTPKASLILSLIFNSIALAVMVLASMGTL